MDLDVVLVWVVGVSAGTGLFGTLRLLRQGAAAVRGWVAVFGALVALLVAGMIAWPERAGLVAAGPWVALVLLPSVGRRAVGRLTQAQRFATASRVARLAALFHPFDGWRDDPTVLEGLSALQRGEVERARRLAHAHRPSSRGRLLELQILRAEGAWHEVRRSIEDLERAGTPLDVESALLYVRALGEMGNPDAMLRSYSRVLTLPLAHATRRTLRMMVGALAGRLDVVEHVLAAHAAAPGSGDLWRATALQTRGDAEAARPLLERLAAAPDWLLAGPARQRLENPLPLVIESRLGPEARRALSELARAARDEQHVAPAPAAHAGWPWVTTALMAANLGVFMLEVPGGTESLDNLARLGALIVPLSHPDAALWRIFTAGFLHFGWLHLGMNLFGMWILGSVLERSAGRLLVITAYLVATIGGNALGLVLLGLSGSGPQIALGASGGVMGLLGAGMARALVGAWRTRSPLARRELGAFAAVLALQTAFDLTTREVSFAIHASGFCLGLAVGLAWSLAGARARARV